ncbi:MAG: PaaI family thioesterase [Beijerinckiaceae bacterium]
MMATIGARLEAIAPGECVIAMPRAESLLQQHGFAHGGAIGMIADSACGYAALSLMPAGSGVLTVEYKINFIAPAAGERFIATGNVLRSGRQLTVSQATVESLNGGERRVIAHMTSTLMTIAGRSDVVD